MSFRKDPAAVLDFAVDWSSWLQDGETITDSTWTVPDGITAGDGSNGAPAPSHASGKATIWLLGGTHDEDYRVVNRIETSAGRTDERTIRVDVRDK